MPDAFTRLLVGTFRRHLLIFVAVNGALTLANFLMGAHWWAFWPLLATSFLLALHYFAYKTLTVDEQWADERIEELNLKSYDRSHIENLKGRYATGLGKKPGENASDDRRR